MLPPIRTSAFSFDQRLPLAGGDGRIRTVVNSRQWQALARCRSLARRSLDGRLASAERAFVGWQDIALERSNILRKAATIIRSRLRRFPAFMTLEQGKCADGVAHRKLARRADITRLVRRGNGRRAMPASSHPASPKLRYSTDAGPVGPVAPLSAVELPVGYPRHGKWLRGLARGRCTCIIHSRRKRRPAPCWPWRRPCRGRGTARGAGSSPWSTWQPVGDLDLI